MKRKIIRSVLAAACVVSFSGLRAEKPEKAFEGESSALSGAPAARTSPPRYVYVRTLKSFGADTEIQDDRLRFQEALYEEAMKDLIEDGREEPPDSYYVGEEPVQAIVSPGNAKVSRGLKDLPGRGGRR